MKRIYIILMLLLSGVVTYATDVKTLAEEATKMYQEGDYQKAIDLYNEMLSDDMEPQLCITIWETVITSKGRLRKLY